MKRLLVVNMLLLAVVVGLVVQIFALWWRAEAEIEEPAPREAKTQRFDLPPAARRAPPPDLAANIADKDLFDPSRSPQQPEAPQAEAPAPPVNLALLGVTVAGGAREALVRDQAQPKPLWIREGEEMSGYKVSRIEPTSIVMVTPGGGEVKLVITTGKAPASAQLLGPAGIQPQQPPPGTRAQRAPVPAPTRTPRMPAADIREKIERLREEARQRRRRQQQER